MNQLSILIIFCPFTSTYRKSSAIFKKPSRSKRVSFDRRDRRTQVRLPQSNEATDRVTKGQAAQPAYAGLANEVVPLRERYFPDINDRVDTNDFFLLRHCPRSHDCFHLQTTFASENAFNTRQNSCYPRQFSLGSVTVSFHKHCII